ncbi:MAG: hypothetical protein ABWZ25_13120 [Chitinophagaceae bacterium]
MILYVLVTTLIAGSLDIAAALINYKINTGKDPMNVLKFIARGLLGKQTYAGPSMMPWIGLIVHFGVTLFWITLFFLTYKIIWRKIPLVVNAIIYGLVVYLLMSFVVLPMTSLPALPRTFVSSIPDVIILMVCIGLPAAIGARRCFGGQRYFMQ